MAGISEHFKKLVYAVAEDLQERLFAGSEEDAKLVQKGLLLYRQGFVSNVRLEDDRLIGVVHDVTPVQVEIDLNFLEISTCTCPAAGTCRHQLAVFFQVYSKIDSVMDWVDEWRAPLKKKKLAANLGLKRAKDLLKNAELIELNYRAWVKDFRNSFHALMHADEHVPAYLTAEYYHAYSRKITASAPVGHEWKNLYFLTANLHTFEMLLRFAVKMGHDADMVNRYYGHIFSSLLEEMEETIEKINVHAMPFAFDPFIEGLKDDAFFLLDDELGMQLERLVLYIALWENLFKKEDWRHHELEKIAAQAEGTSAAIATTDHLIMLGEDDKALEILQNMGISTALYYPKWFTHLSRQKEWHRIGPYAEHFASIFGELLHRMYDFHEQRDFIKQTLTTLEPYIQKENRTDLYEKLLFQALPYTYWAYEEFLFENKRYEKWTDLQVWLGNEMDAIPQERVRFFEDEQPEALLPIYHQLIQKHIDMKNRAHYREAVQLLKKLRRLYRGMKRTNDWEQFFRQLREQTKRLRAFHQELERGKLIDA